MSPTRPELFGVRPLANQMSLFDGLGESTFVRRGAAVRKLSLYERADILSLQVFKDLCRVVCDDNRIS